MRKLIVAAFVTLDGVMQAPGAPEEDISGGFAYGGWTVDYWDAAMGEAMEETFASPFDLLLGRKTYEIFAAHWPYVGEGDPIGETFNRITKYVATSSTDPLAWRGSVALRGEVPAKVAALKREDGPNLLTQGSSVLIQSLMANRLVDEYRLLVFPVLLGTGKRLFGDSTIPAALKLIDGKTSSTGVFMGTYVPDGPVHTGSFALEPPTEAELARREKVKLED